MEILTHMQKFTPIYLRVYEWVGMFKYVFVYVCGWLLKMELSKKNKMNNK